MTRLILKIGLSLIFLTLLNSCHTQSPRGGNEGNLEVLQAEYDVLVRDLHSLNLINGLHLSKDQMNKMLPLIEESANLEQELARAKQVKFADFNDALRKIRTRLESHNDITEELQNRLDRASLPLEVIEAKKRDRMKILCRDALNILNENQRFVLENYEPCMVPTPNISEPERIGGVISSREFADQLEILRKLPEGQYQLAKKHLLDEKAMRMKVFNRDFQIRSVITQMDKALDLSRKLSEEEFEIRKVQLSTIRMPPSKRKGMEEEFAARYLLNPYIGGIFKNRIRNDGKGEVK